MQGVIAEEAPRPSLRERLIEWYEKRVPFSEFISFSKISTPESTNRAWDKIKMNWEKFAFYYISLFCGLDLIFVFLRRLTIIPIAITIGAIFIASGGLVIAGTLITPFHAIIGCLFTHMVMCIMFSSLAKVYVYFFAFNAFILLLVLVHGALVDSEDNDGEVLV
ncbi:PRA1 family protein 1 [Pancytospora epiphaga]|nr:PRA1 family protein 1 [Pancytospora epiphaga]